jgi:transcriptional regulator with XRE-family HTH domain
VRTKFDGKLVKELQIFGANLRRERTNRDITQEKLAELADLNIRTLQKIEAGQTNILITTAKRLRKGLGCSWESLLD